ncbi:cellulose-binding domain-containing protein, partial [Streptomyces albidoflavus]|uniref:cellulose-binding domain-containing protein n=1 Tax=Streptomyces albidoflavus TaxID=1886 RepID=UPI0015C8B0EB
MSTVSPSTDGARSRPRPLSRFRRRALAALVGLAVPFAGMVGLAAPTQAAEAAADPSASYTRTQDWGSGFEGKWTVKNTGTAPLSGWTLEWDFPSGTKVTSAWDADVTNNGDHWTAKNKSWAGSLAPGASVSFGFNGTGPGTPSGCKLNGASCDGASVPGDTPPTCLLYPS